MKIVNRDANLIRVTVESENLIEKCGRVCYKSEDKITDESSAKFIKKLISMGHESVLEHASATFKIICDRSTSHQWVRHRAGFSYSQESQRYCNYNKDKFGGVSFIVPKGMNENSQEYKSFIEHLKYTETQYENMIADEFPPEVARSILPNCTKTELCVTGNFRSWRNFLKERLTYGAQSDIKEISVIVLDRLHQCAPSVFEDLKNHFVEEM